VLDEKIKKLANTIVNYSINVQKGERVRITYEDKECSVLVKEIVRLVFEKGGIPFTCLIDTEMSTYCAENNTKDRIEEFKKHFKFQVDNYDSFISVFYNVNDYESKDVSSKIRKIV